MLVFGAMPSGPAEAQSPQPLDDWKVRLQSDAQGICSSGAERYIAQGDPHVQYLMDLVALGLSVLAAANLAKPIRALFWSFSRTRGGQEAAALENLSVSDERA